PSPNCDINQRGHDQPDHYASRHNWNQCGISAHTHTCGSSLAAGASCSISVTFRPTASVVLTAALTITDNAAGRPQSATLTGYGRSCARLANPSQETP